MLQNNVDINLPKRITNVKTNSRNALEKDLEITHNNTQNVLSNEYLVATDAETKTNKKPQFHPLLEGLVTDVSIGDSVSCVSD